MNAAYAQTAEIIGAGSEAVAKYNDQAGVAAGTAMLFCAIMLVILYFMFRRLEKRDQEIAEMRVDHEKAIAKVELDHAAELAEQRSKCVQEIAQARAAAEAEAEETKRFYAQRTGEIFGSVKELFQKVDTSSTKMADVLSALQITLATKGITVK